MRVDVHNQSELLLNIKNNRRRFCEYFSSSSSLTHCFIKIGDKFSLWNRHPVWMKRSYIKVFKYILGKAWWSEKIKFISNDLQWQVSTKKTVKFDQMIVKKLIANGEKNDIILSPLNYLVLTIRWILSKRTFNVYSGKYKKLKKLCWAASSDSGWI